MRERRAKGGSDTPTGRHATTGSCSQVWTRAAETHRHATSTQLRLHLLPTYYKLGAGSTKGSLGAPSRRRVRRVWGSMACKAAVRMMQQRSGRRVNASSIKQRRLIKVENWLSFFFSIRLCFHSIWAGRVEMVPNICNVWEKLQPICNETFYDFFFNRCDLTERMCKLEGGNVCRLWLQQQHKRQRR